MTNQEKALELHAKLQGKLETVSKTPVRTREDLALVYTPGVAEPCKVIAKDPAAAYTYTMKANTVEAFDPRVADVVADAVKKNIR